MTSPTQEFLRRLAGFRLRRPPTFQVVLGSGFGSALEASETGEWKPRGTISFTEVGLGATKVIDHAGLFRIFENEQSGASVIFQSGRLHGYEGYSAREAVAPVMLTRLAGVSNYLLTNASGGIDPNYRVGDALLLRDHVNLTGQNPLVGANPTGLDGQPLGPRFPDLSATYDAEWRASLGEKLRRHRLRAQEGTYLGLLGPSFETPAEIQLFASWKLHAVGMSTVWEAIALKHSGARLAALSLISNAACGLGDGAPLDHERSLQACRASARSMIHAILEWLHERTSEK